MKCALCGAEDLFDEVSHRDAKSNERLLVSMCKECGLVQQTPIPSSDELKIYYSHNYRKDYKKTYTPRPEHIYRAGRTAIPRIDFLTRAGISGGKLLDIGAGGGEFVYLAGRSGFDAEGVEPSIGYSEFASQEYGCDVKTGELDDIASSYDAITMFHVLEHLPSPRRAFEKLYTLLNRRGKLFVEVPWIETNDASPSNIYFKAHIFYFNADTLISCASQYFDVVSVDTSSNLKVLFEAKDDPAPLALPSAASIERVRERLESKGWLEYIFSGKGYMKPLTKAARGIQESKAKGTPPRQILDRLVEGGRTV